MAIIPAEEKVFMVSNSTNTTYSGSAALKAMQQWYTMEDVTNTVRPYQVFTALLTQSGGDNVEQISSGELTAGVTYLFAQSQAGDDFRNVGGPLVTYADEFLGTSFVATLTATPNNWVEAVLIYNTGAPVATVLENTIGNIWFTYDSLGTYIIKSNSLFTDNKFALFMGNMVTEPAVNISCIKIDESTVYMSVTQADNSADGELTNTPIEIRVYN